jgi:5-methyltetrahydrofolate--homocysteine methyltransferase
VKGDVHDIGKNLVDIILSNNGYNVINLGIKITSQELIQAFRKYNPDFIGLSGLLVKSAQMMVETAEDLFKENIKVPILVGGAALTEKFTYLNILPSYKNNVIYATDAMSGLDIINSINDIEKKDQLFNDIENKITHYKTNVVSSSKSLKTNISNRNIEKINPVEIIPQPPDLKEHILELPLDEVWELINPVMLFNRHLGYKGNFLKNLNNGDNKAQSLLKSVNDVKNIISESNQFTSKVVYKFFNAQSDNDDVVLYNQGNEIERFQFARQTDKDRLCLSDYLQPTNSEKKDYISLFVTTFGPNIRELSEFYLNKGDFLISHVISSLALETAEASAEYIHKKIRTMWGISDDDQITNSDIFKANYIGKRFSFGYPACPLLEDQYKLWKLLNPLETIGVNLTEEYMMDPEGSVSAIVFHHPQAKYFNVDADGIDNLNKRIND